MMTAETNAAIEGALAAGATAVLVNDSHWQMRNLIAEDLHPAAELLSGGPKLRSMVEGVELGFAAALLIGYHARAGTPHAVIDHTYTSRVHEVRLNGRPVGELGINAALAGTYGVPVAMVSGDQALAAEAREWLGPGVETVVVKHAVWRFAARSLAPSEACRRIREGAAAALGRPHAPLALPQPVRLEVEFALTQMADMAELAPGSVRTGGRTLAYTHEDYREVFRAWRALYNLASVE
jgi:D-amino peptidase